MKPLFMWAGGKTKMLKHYKSVLPKRFDSYIEPFFGGGSMMLEAIRINPKAKVYINDINEGIINIYKAIQSNPKSFTQKLDEYSSVYLPKSKEERKEYYYELRSKHAFEFKDLSKVDEAALLYFLMKTGFNGIWQINKNTNNRFGTPCGLLNQKDAVYDRKTVMEWHKVLQQATITSQNFTECFKAVDKNAWVFMDPPYRGGFTTYGIQFDDSHQKCVLDSARLLTASNNAEVWVTNRDIGDGFFDNLAGFETYKFDVTYTAGRRKKTEDGYEAKKAVEVLLISKP